jgi:hypothetical protein
MVCAARIVESVPDLDATFYSATQTMDEARHAEIYGDTGLWGKRLQQAYGHGRPRVG